MVKYTCVRWFICLVFWKSSIVFLYNHNKIYYCSLFYYRELKERNSVDGHLLATWSRDSIESCVKISFDPIKIQMNFMTIRKNLNQRIYIMSDIDAKVS